MKTERRSISSYSTPTMIVLLWFACTTSAEGLLMPTTKTRILPRPLGRSMMVRGGRPVLEGRKRLKGWTTRTTNTLSNSNTDTTNDEPKSASASAVSARPSIDFVAIGKYGAALAMQMSLIFGLLTGMDKLLAKYAVKVPFAVNFIFFYFFNLKMSIFSPLPNKKQENTSDWEYTRRNKPSWTPPGLVFAFMWPIFVFGIRAATAAQIVRLSGGVYASPPILSLFLHWAVGTLWNTVNNVERRLGPSVILLYGLWLTKALAAYQFFRIDPLCGKWLAATLTWLTAAAALETRTWQINPDPDTGKPEPLYPAKGKWKTRFRWE